ncbi:MAG: M28 family metallopeptidase [Gammaproteobacteria bacterium]|nr:M28 family metallopeptidase [Gammaproteobacteria bacterium]
MYTARFGCLALAIMIAGCEARQHTPQPDPAPATRSGIEAIDADSYRDRVRKLASDEFEGRAPFTDGETKTIEFLREEFQKAGLVPGNGDSWYQKVPLVEITSESASLTLTGHSNLEPPLGEDAIIWTKRVTDAVKLSDSELVFVGYGIVAPEYDWDDYEGIDVNGKTVVMLVNDPGYATQDANLFHGNAMTYYGRWTYKYEEAARQGAAGAIVIHEVQPAGYPWEVVSSGWTGPQFDLVTADKNFSRPVIEGWINTTTAAEIFAAAGITLEDARRAALHSDFEAKVLPWKVSGEIKNSIRESSSYNVLGLLPGSDLADEYIVYMAHWDHMGRDESLEGDQIFNGAVDNATGTTALLELAEAFASVEPPVRRSVLFVAVTAEESGLLGSRYYGTNPVYPLANTVAGVNMDGLNVHGRTRDVAVVGFGSSELEQYLSRAARSQDRVIVAEPTPEKGFFYRSDHFNLAKQGVPVLYAESGFDYREGGTRRGTELARDWIENRYHKVGDEYREDWDMSGAIEDIRLYFMIGHELAASDAWPEWYSTSEFKNIREAMLETAGSR